MIDFLSNDVKRGAPNYFTTRIREKSAVKYIANVSICCVSVQQLIFGGVYCYLLIWHAKHLLAARNGKF